ncbi:hypothetical protein IU486_32410 [Streptomyces gardneri]|uniref:hypothetical protein n=1 Tax=Nocardia TaxID=1817 RepID=UPI00135769B4|nr:MULTISPECIES: hypothetical protein [Nocardia]MBF6169398.1 hypothetical protein [Streptomyces gardneri]MBF6209249.1 hypothetical protein [Streptomyces gardneri]
MARRADHADGHDSPASRTETRELRAFLTRYRYLAPALTVAVALLGLLAGIGEGGVWAIVSAIGLGAVTAAVACLAWDLWLYP